MPSLPTLGQKPWKQQLEDWLLVAHNVDGTAKVGYGTTLPASPIDGQEHVLVDNTVGSFLYIWRFRYNAASTDPNKWEFVGGTQWLAESLSNVAINAAATWQKLSQTVPIPNNGWYELEAIVPVAFGVSAAVTQLQVLPGTASGQIGSPAYCILPALASPYRTGSIIARTQKQISTAPTTASVWVQSDRTDTIIGPGAKIAVTPIQIR
jgi:hypothetical protein